MYELTALLSTVASCSATIIAIIGGFMVRKLIAMSTERHEIFYRLNEMDEEIRFKREEIAVWNEHLRENPSADSDPRERLESEIAWTLLKRRQTEARLEYLKNPHGMKRGLLIFAMYSLLGVLLPLSLIPFKTDVYSHFLLIKITILSLLAFCLLFVYRYLLYLLRWRQKDVAERWREYFHQSLPPNDSNESEQKTSK